MSDCPCAGTTKVRQRQMPENSRWTVIVLFDFSGTTVN